MKVLVAGDWHSELHEEVVLRAFAALGQEVFRFSWHQYFAPKGGFGSGALRWSGKIQNKLLAGPLFARLNADFLELARQIRPDAIFVYRGTHISARSLQRIRAELPSTVLVGYNNDDPFAKGHSRLLWRHFLAALPEYDLMLAYRLHNVEDFRRAGARRVELLRSWYVPERNKPVHLSAEERERYQCDLVFAGHYEPDGRLALMERICREGFRFRLFGPEWGRVVGRSPFLGRLGPVAPLGGAEYNKALCGGKIALCLLSKLNRDTYTRRCFEIPAAGTLLLAEYSDDLARLFREGVEAVFFRSEEDLVRQLRYYLAHDEERRAIALAGQRRVQADGHDVVTRMKQVLGWMGACATSRD
jgi:spore maturation protein CgeB